MLKALMKCMKDMPPADFVVGSWAKAKMPKPISEQTAGLPVRKGKVKRRGN
jgi:hypothetical protein